MQKQTQKAMQEQAQKQMIEISYNDIEQIADFFHIVHHIPGRIRIRANISALPAAKQWAHHTPLRALLPDSQDITQEIVFTLLKRIPAIQDIKINAIVGSATIHYDKTQFEPSLWESWVKKEDLQTLHRTLNTLLHAHT